MTQTRDYADTIVCIIPCKPYHQAKTRLADCLRLEQRVQLSRWLLRRTLRLVRRHFPCIVVVSRDPQVLHDARQYGGLPLEEVGEDLNAALTQASHFAITLGAAGTLILPTDLPFLTDQDVHGLSCAAVRAPAMVIAPCQHGTGTNALLVRPPLLIPFQFGATSFVRHVASAQAIGIQPTVVRTLTLAFDLDTPEDWNAFCKMKTHR
ncbi:MAG: 2-phospho-L-lactate guanylyltransferase [Anaerolineae bacterium]|nr:2-phospho-L-lactate guanylyltransferase [Anaerolineae bacterium]MDW8070623.1 2-phospho-L-lactate guanylyltransferase [Anaerolineae bacterium]